jgi:5-methylcytosine-specific restriction enzyme subunit McrC
MVTDITLRGPKRVLIIDAKYYQQTLVAPREAAVHKIISGHLYQLNAYLGAWAAQYPTGPRPEGMLLYPTVQDHVDLKLELNGYPLRVATVNLDQEWGRIGEELSGLILPLITDPD